MLHQKTVRLEGGEEKSGADQDKDGSHDGAECEIAGLEIPASNHQGVKEQESTAQERKGENGQNDGADFRPLGHDFIVGSVGLGPGFLPDNGSRNRTCPGGQVRSRSLHRDVFLAPDELLARFQRTTI